MHVHLMIFQRKLNRGKNSKMEIKISIPARLHITLVSMHLNSYRQNGGIGFAIDYPYLEIEFKDATTIEIHDNRKYGFSKEELERIFFILKKEKDRLNFNKGFIAKLNGEVDTHMGFGSTTATRLALIEALYIFNKSDYSKNDIIKASQRGGVSGIGIQTYFKGGMIFDIGRSSKGSFVPSGSMEDINKELPLILQNKKMPMWEIGICIPNIKPKSELEEKIFFNDTCPIDASESYKVLYHIIYGVLASIIENDKETFFEAIQEIQKCQWKKSEKSLYSNALKDVEKKLYDCGASMVGMSSLGPTIFFMGEDMNLIIKKAKDKLTESKFFLTLPNNVGRSIKYV